MLCMDNKEKSMDSRRILGFVLLAIGIFAFGIGISSSRSVADQVSNTFIGRFTDTTTWYLLGGIAAAVFGLMLVSFGYRGKKS